MSTSSQPAPRRKFLRFVLGFVFGMILSFLVIRNWQDIKAGFRDGYAASAKAFR